MPLSLTGSILPVASNDASASHPARYRNPQPFGSSEDLLQKAREPPPPWHLEPTGSMNP
eukprot:CAMPEP_0114655524 /NCGR_PEP_ID=MMETSP0191-20121206/11161_1 /TAXON_ID=126664 /ORGANISM="Sorites sp." /LENGTH=58 /DNA_ID=CAMNT_0001871287 /DNA_START=260 /DNA_END=436 /DNA_ORIENTATION=+